MSKQQKWRSYLPTSGWRRTAAINTALVTVVCAILAATLIRSVALSGGSVERSLVFYQGSCTDSGRLNLVLHLVINIISTAIIASSNYFMQVLSSPSREEIDKAHRRLHSLEIGVPSLGNIGYISRVKAALWLLFLLSSVPLHVVFNSAVFATDYQGAQFFMAMATEDFVGGGGGGHDYPLLGASLVFPGASMNQSVAESMWGGGDWGLLVEESQFFNRSSTMAQNLSSLSAPAPSWTRLDGPDCRAQYGTCTPRREYGDVVLVVDSRFQSDAASTTQLSDPAGFIVRAYWNRFGPVDQPNPLWFSALCSINTVGHSMDTCERSCATPLGLNPGYNSAREDNNYKSNTTSPWDIPLTPYKALPDNVDPFPVLGTTIEYRPRFNTANIGSNPSLRVTHCYAQPQPLQFPCKVALSNTILLAVTIAVGIKAVLALLACVLVRGNPLVTPGDAMASFLTLPDHMTKGKAGIRKQSLKPEELRPVWTTAPKRQEWPHHGDRPPRIGAGIPYSAWVRTYALIMVVLLITAILLNMAAQKTPISQDTNAFSHSGNQLTGIVGVASLKNISFVGKVILANTPQLLLSLCYFAYNALFTRACTEMEWNSYAVSYKPLRVSYPAKGQVSTYRLQLPYRYSVPLIAVSILLHWLVSNTIFVTIIDGDYLRDGESILHGISDKAYIALGFSSRATLIVFLLGLVVAVVPLGFFLRRLKADMVICGNDSFTISAACHASALIVVSAEKSPAPEGNVNSNAASRREDSSEADDERELETLSETEALAEEVNMRQLLQVTRSQVRWGVVAMPRDWYASFRGDGHDSEAGHLTFGTRDQNVKEPQGGRFYI
ncbi:hypothetical protein V8F06_014414 [Rhypophila decipiens]